MLTAQEGLTLRLAEFACDTHTLPVDVRAAARVALQDTLGVALAGSTEPAVLAALDYARESSGGRGARIWGHDVSCAPADAALVNAIATHALDFDDTLATLRGHPSAPVLAAALATAAHSRISGSDLLTAYALGIEVSGKLGQLLGNGHYLRGWHNTATLGVFSATATVARLCGAPSAVLQSAWGIAAAQSGGLLRNFGTMAKPFHAGKAALNGMLAAQMAQAGFSGSTLLLEQNAGLGQALVRDQATVPKVFETDRWELLRNGFKPYACCLLTHAAVDSARILRDKLRGKNIVSIEARVHPLTIKLAGKTELTSPLEGKFSTAFVIALGLSGYTASRDDFSLERLRDPALLSLASKVTLVPDPALAETAASLLIKSSDGSVTADQTLIAKGHPDNPMTWTDMYEKFKPLVEPTLGSQTLELFEILKNFEQPNHLNKLEKILAALPAMALPKLT